MSTRALVHAGVALALVGCGGAESRAREPQGPPPRLEPLRLPDGPIPGTPVEGEFVDSGGRLLDGAREMAAAGTGANRVSLLLARGEGSVPCIGVRLGSAPRIAFDCFAQWERPPLAVKVAVGGPNGRVTGWLAVVGIAGEGVGRVEIDAGFASARSLELREPSDYPWQAFAVLTDENHLANTLVARSRNDAVVASVELSWAYHPPCFPENDDICGEGPPPGPWAEVRDPVEAASGARDLEAVHAIAFEDASVRRLAAGRTYFVGPTARWEACSGRRLGAVVFLRFHPPVRFSGEIPIHEQADDDDEAVAYREGRAYVEADEITAVDIWVDHARGRVVGINLEAFDTMVFEDEPTAKIDEYDEIEEPAPAGGPDEPDACPEHDFGD